MRNMADVFEHDRRDVLNHGAADFVRGLNRATARTHRRRLIVHLVIDAVGYRPMGANVSRLAAWTLCSAAPPSSLGTRRPTFPSLARATLPRVEPNPKLRVLFAKVL